MKLKKIIIVILYLAVLTPILCLAIHSVFGIHINYAKIQVIYNLFLFILTIKYITKVQIQSGRILLFLIILLVFLNFFGASILSGSILKGAGVSIRLFSRYYFFIYFGIMCSLIFGTELRQFISWLSFSSLCISIVNLILFIDLITLRILFPFIRNYQIGFQTGNFAANLLNASNTGIDFRFYGYFFDTYTQYLFPLAGLVLLLYPLQKQQIDIYYFIKFIIFASSIILSTVKTAWVQLIIILLFYLLININRKTTYKILSYSLPLVLPLLIIFISINYESISSVFATLFTGRDFTFLIYGITNGIPLTIINNPFLSIFGGNIDYQFLNNFTYLDYMEVFFLRLVQYCGVGALFIYFTPLFSRYVWKKNQFSRFTLFLLFVVLLSGMHYEVMVTSANIFLSSFAFMMVFLCKKNYLLHKY